MIYTIFEYIVKAILVVLVTLFIVAMITPIAIIVGFFIVVAFIVRIVIRIYEDIKAEFDSEYKKELIIERKIIALHKLIMKAHGKYVYLSSEFFYMLPLNSRDEYGWYDDIDQITYYSICVLDDEMKGLEFSHKPKMQIVESIEDLYN